MSSSDSYPCTAAQTAGFLSAERNNLAAERFPFEIVLIVPSVASSRELLNSYYTLENSRPWIPFLASTVETERQLVSRRDRV